MKKSILALGMLIFASGACSAQVIPITNRTDFNVCVQFEFAGFDLVLANKTVNESIGAGRILNAFQVDSTSSCVTASFPAFVTKPCTTAEPTAVNIVGGNVQHLIVNCH